jgi:hypothetical protein
LALSVAAPDACEKAGAAMEAASKITAAALIREFIVLLLVQTLTNFRSSPFHIGCVARPQVTPVTGEEPDLAPRPISSVFIARDCLLLLDFPIRVASRGK